MFWNAFTCLRHCQNRERIRKKRSMTFYDDEKKNFFSFFFFVLFLKYNETKGTPFVYSVPTARNSFNGGRQKGATFPRCKRKSCTYVSFFVCYFIFFFFFFF